MASRATRSKQIVSILAFGILLYATSAPASDGVLEINQVCATTTGCFPGDNPGFPVSLAGSGAYRLTGNLTLPDENTTAIAIWAFNVDIDLAGFSIQGPGEVGTGDGIFQPTPYQNAHVHGGSIVGVGRHGVDLHDFAQVEDLRVSGSGDRGIFVSTASIVRRNVVTSSGGDGIDAWVSSLVGNNVVEGSGGYGIRINTGALVHDNIVRSATLVEIVATAGAYSGNTVTDDSGGDPNFVISGGDDLGDNLCGLDVTCP